MSAGTEGIPAQRAQIAAEMLRVHEVSHGTGAAAVVVHILEDLVVVLLDGLELSLTERTLIDGGETATVLQTRAAFREAIGSTLSQIVERATGRRVSGSLGTTSLDPLCSVELFRLHPVAA